MERLPYGFCGMPCALCPHYHSKGLSRCEGCSRDGFFTGACNIYKCCKKTEVVHCSFCTNYPCHKCEALKEFNCLNTNGVWVRTVSSIQKFGLEVWYEAYSRKAALLTRALEQYNNGRMKRYLCELFINTDLVTLEKIMERASKLNGSKKEVSQMIKKVVSEEV